MIDQSDASTGDVMVDQSPVDPIRGIETEPEIN